VKPDFDAISKMLLDRTFGNGSARGYRNVLRHSRVFQTLGSPTEGENKKTDQKKWKVAMTIEIDKLDTCRFANATVTRPPAKPEA
jgi:hypothetical protein